MKYFWINISILIIIEIFYVTTVTASPFGNIGLNKNCKKEKVKEECRKVCGATDSCVAGCMYYAMHSTTRTCFVASYRVKFPYANEELIKAYLKDDEGKKDGDDKKSGDKPAGEEKKPAEEEKKPAGEKKKPAGEEKKPGI